MKKKTLTLTWLLACHIIFLIDRRLHDVRIQTNAQNEEVKQFLCYKKHL